MKTPNKDVLEPRLLAVELAIDTALRKSFDTDSCLELTERLDELFDTILEEDESIPIGIDDNKTLASKALSMADIAYACWMSDEPAIPLPQEVLLAHIARMRFNPEHCKFVIGLARMFVKKHGKLLSVQEISLRVP